MNEDVCRWTLELDSGVCVSHDRGWEAFCGIRTGEDGT